MIKVIVLLFGIVLSLISFSAYSQSPDPSGPWVGWPWVAGLCLGITFIATSKVFELVKAMFTDLATRTAKAEERIGQIEKDHYDSDDVDDKLKQIVDLVEKVSSLQAKQTETLAYIREKMIKLESKWGAVD